MDQFYLLLLSISIPIPITWFSIDIIRKISIKFRVFAVPNERSSHSKIVPATGGLALLISWLVIIFLQIPLNQYPLDGNLYFFMLAGIIIAIVGFYDDLKEMPSFLKLLMQVFVFFIISFTDNILINSFHGLFGIYEIGYVESIIFSLFVFIVIVNSINLIDGIDGLSASLSLFFLIISSYVYYISDYYYLLLLLSFISTLFVFLYFNFSTTKKIFLGDTGSLGLGLFIAVLSLSFLNTNHPSFDFFPFNPALFVVLMLSYPLLDVIRVFIIRIYNRKSFMDPDRNHIHHKLVDIGLSHKKSVILIVLFQLLLLIINTVLSNILSLHLLIVLNIIIVLTTISILYKVPNKSIL